MTDAQAVRCRKRLKQFLVDLLELVGRRERRHWGEVYVRSLLLNGERKSIEPLATRLPEGNVQAMQQFIGQSPWEWNPVWERLGKRMTAELEPDPAWVVDDTGFPKQGTCNGPQSLRPMLSRCFPASFADCFRCGMTDRGEASARGGIGYRFV